MLPSSRPMSSCSPRERVARALGAVASDGDEPSAHLAGRAVRPRRDAVGRRVRRHRRPAASARAGARPEAARRHGSWQRRAAGWRRKTGNRASSRRKRRCSGRRRRVRRHRPSRAGDRHHGVRRQGGAACFPLAAPAVSPGWIAAGGAIRTKRRTGWRPGYAWSTWCRSALRSSRGWIEGESRRLGRDRPARP